MSLSLSEFVRFTHDAGTAVLATASRSGKPEAALKGIAVSDTGELIVDITANARKLANLAENDEVAVVIGWAGDVSIQVEGHARLVTGAERTGPIGYPHSPDQRL